MNCNPSKIMKRYNHLLGEIDSAYHEMSRKLGLSDSAMIVLYTICDNGTNCLLQDICRRSGLSKQTVNSALRKLEQSGAVDTQGGRTKRVRLTEAGQSLARDTALRVLEIETEIYDSWSREELDSYITLTERYLSAFKEKIKGL